MNRQQLLDAINAKKAALEALFAAVKTAEGFNATAEQVTEIETKQAEYDAAVQALTDHDAAQKKLSDFEAKNALVVIRNRPEGPVGPGNDDGTKGDPAKGGSFKDLLTSDNVQELRDTKVLEIQGVDLKTLFSTAAGMPTRAENESRIAMLPERKIRLFDYLPTTYRDGAAPTVSYYSEKTRTDAAAFRNESTQATPSPLAESTYEYELIEATARMVGHHLPVTVEQMMDHEELATILDNRMRYGLMDQAEKKALAGTGVAPQILGFLNYSGIQTQAKGADTIQTAVVKARTKIAVNAEEVANFLIIHPSDAEKVVLTTDLNGRPIQTEEYAIFSELFRNRLETTAIAQGTALVGVAGQALNEFIDSVRLEYTDSHSDDFTNLRRRIRCYVRMRTRLFRQPSLCTVTGL